jgi:hypothetical protein
MAAPTQNTDDMAAQPQPVDDMAAPTQNTDDMAAQPQPVDDMAAPTQNTDDMAAQPQPVDDMAAPTQNTDDMAAQPQPVDDMAAPTQNTDDMAAQPQPVDDMAAPTQNTDDMAAQPQQIDEMAATPHTIEDTVDYPQNTGETAPLPEYYTGDELSMSKEDLDAITASMNQAIEEYETVGPENIVDDNAHAPNLEVGDGVNRRVPDSWISKLEELGWEDLTPEQVRNIPKPSDFSDDQKKTVAYNISSTVNALLNMDEFLIDTATPKEKAFIERMPPDMLPPKLDLSEDVKPEVEHEKEPEHEVQSDFTRRKR